MPRNIKLPPVLSFVFFGGKPYLCTSSTDDGWCWLCHPENEPCKAAAGYAHIKYPDDPKDRFYVHVTQLIFAERNEDGTYRPA